MKIDIIGAGSLGLLLAGRLILAGNEVRIWCRSDEQTRALSLSGITISYEDERPPIHVAGDRFLAGVVTEFTEAYRQAPGEWIMITVKQNVLHRDLPAVLLPLGEEQPCIVCFQNGIGHMEMLKQLMPKSHLYAAVTTEAAKKKTTCAVIHAGAGEVWIGKASGENNNLGSPTNFGKELEVIRLLETLSFAGFSAYLSKEMNTMIYRKLLINAVINPLTAIWRIPNGGLLASGERLKLMRELYDEAVAVYDACGIVYENGAWDSIIGVCRATSGNTSSMLADVLAARATEIRWINGSIVEMAERSGLAVPLHRWMCRMVEGMIAEER
jgi:2-dehydropantoate 2-reductase